MIPKCGGNLQNNIRQHPFVAHILAHRLQQAGVEIVFGLPGGETVELIDELRQTGIRFVLVHSESSAVFMADATARLTGKLGVCLTTLGPGAANAVAGVAHAYLDRSPVLVITAQKPDYLLPEYTHQIIDLHALFAPITKASFKLQPAGVIETIDSVPSGHWMKEPLEKMMSQSKSCVGPPVPLMVNEPPAEPSLPSEPRV